ncbi:MAG TPA: RING finger protein [Chlamydiales bacterium]|nr:RING finger protein [Chlamydiales bacterium]
MAGLAAAIREGQGNYQALDVMPPPERRVPARAAAVHAVALQTVVGKKSVDERGAETVTLVLKGSEVEEKDKRQVECNICYENRDEVLSHEPFLHASSCEECLPRLLAMKNPPECPHCSIKITEVNGEAYEAAPPEAALPQENLFADNRGRNIVSALALPMEVAGAVTWGVGQILDLHPVIAGGSVALIAGLTVSLEINVIQRRRPLNGIAKLVTVAFVAAGVVTGSAPLAITGAALSTALIARDAYTFVKAARA